MSKIICCIPADSQGNKLFVKELRQEKRKLFIKYKSTYNDLPFMEVEIFIADGGKNAIITGDDGTVIFRFPVEFLKRLSIENQ